MVASNRNNVVTVLKSKRAAIKRYGVVRVCGTESFTQTQ